jgi:2-C-methyl-D-erythritol 4-phosphate cytidylyltransferase/2-C-methyl-D-erythritol 2,4-cyclodiphosphate synthase
LQDTTLIVLCAGESSRFSLAPKKQWLRCHDIPLWYYVTQKIVTTNSFSKVILVGHKNEINYMKNFTTEYEIVEGGSSRQESLKNGLQKVTSKYVMVTDVARACVPNSVIKSLYENKKQADIIVPVLSVHDTVVYENETINRDKVKLIQTPQLSDTKKLMEALNTNHEFTDDSSAIKENGGSVYYVEGSKQSIKLTAGVELSEISCLPSPSGDFFMGTGIDIHPFEDGKKMYLGGEYIQSPFGFKAHSDGDVLIHSVIDAILGAIGAGDIGEFFPDTDEKYKGADSKALLEYIVKFVSDVGYEIVNVDVSIIAQIPKINPHKQKIKDTMANLLQIPRDKFNIKATTAEHLGFIGRKEAVAVQSSATLKYYNWKEKAL